MKKHISVADFMQLTGNQQEYLRDIWTPRQNDLFFIKKDGYSKMMERPYPIYTEDGKEHIEVKTIFNEREHYNAKLYPCFTIGDMIEILYGLKKGLYIERNEGETDLCVEISRRSEEDEIGNTTEIVDFSQDKDNLCDALWESIKWCLKEGLI